MHESVSQTNRRLVTLREQRQYACGCSTTRIERYWQADGEVACQAHGGALQHSSVAYAYGEPAQAAAMAQSE